MDLRRFHPDWWSDAVCFSVGWDKFFGDENSTTSLNAARQMCGECPVSKTCLKHALTIPEEFGIWAGTSARSRESMRRYIEQGVEVDAIVEIVHDSDFRWRADERRRLDLSGECSQ